MRDVIPANCNLSVSLLAEEEADGTHSFMTRVSFVSPCSSSRSSSSPPPKATTPTPANRVATTEVATDVAANSRSHRTLPFVLAVIGSTSSRPAAQILISLTPILTRSRRNSPRSPSPPHTAFRSVFHGESKYPLLVSGSSSYPESPALEPLLPSPASLLLILSIESARSDFHPDTVAAGGRSM